MTETVATAEADLRRALDLLANAVEDRARALAEADALVAAARDIAEAKVGAYSDALLDDGMQVADLALVRTMYWEHPQIAASTLAPLLQLRHAGEVFAAVGTHSTEQPCAGACGALIGVLYANRTESRSSTRQPLCRECAAARDREIARDAVKIARRRMAGWEWAGELDRAKELAAAGTQPARVYVEYPGVSGTFLVDGASIGAGHIVGER